MITGSDWPHDWTLTHPLEQSHDRFSTIFCECDHIQVWVLIWIWCLCNVHVPFPNPCPCIVGLVIVLHQRWWLYKLYARQPLDQCQSGRSYLVECNYIALPCRHQASQCAAYNSPTEGVQCKQRHTVIFDPAQVWQSLICRPLQLALDSARFEFTL